MMKPWQKAFLALLCCAIALIVVDKVTNWTLEYKLIIPGAILALGLLIAFWTSIFKKMPAPIVIATPARPAPAPKPAPKPAAKKTSTPGDGGWFSIIFGFAMLIGGGYWIIYCFVPWVYTFTDKKLEELPDHPPYISGITPIGHNAKPPTTVPTREKPEPDTFNKVLQPGKIYDVFHLYHKQIWNWNYVENDLEFRIKDTGNEAFEVVHGAMSTGHYSIQGQDWQANEHAGLLQVRSIHVRQRVKLIRTNRFSE